MVSRKSKPGVMSASAPESQRSYGQACTACRERKRKCRPSEAQPGVCMLCAKSGEHCEMYRSARAEVLTLRGISDVAVSVRRANPGTQPANLVLPRTGTRALQRRTTDHRSPRARTLDTQSSQWSDRLGIVRLEQRATCRSWPMLACQITVSRPPLLPLPIYHQSFIRIRCLTQARSRRFYSTVMARPLLVRHPLPMAPRIKPRCRTWSVESVETRQCCR